MTSPTFPGKELQGRILHLCDQMRSDHQNLEQELEPYDDAILALRVSRMTADMQHKIWLSSYDIREPEGKTKCKDLSGPASSFGNMSKARRCAIFEVAKRLREEGTRDEDRETRENEKEVRRETARGRLAKEFGKI